MAGHLFNLIYLLLIIGISPALLYQSWLHGKYRDGWNEKLFGNLPERTNFDKKRIWLHAVSVGEVLQLQQVIGELRRHSIPIDILITTTTQTGYKVAKDKLKGCEVAYFPLDFTWSIQNSLQRVRPDLIVLVELELWPNLLRMANQRKIPVVLINGRLSEKSFRGYRKLRCLFSKLLNQLTRIAVQSEEYQQRFEALGCQKELITVTGSIKFDGIQTDREREPVKLLRAFFELQPDDLVFIAGSTQHPEEEMALKAYYTLLKSVPEARLIIVPRHPERGNAIARTIEESGYALIRRSDLTKSGTGKPLVGLLDTVGELNDCWALADVAFVGGSFGNRGGQNMLEPAAYGVAVCCGPNTKNFRQIVERLHSHSAVQIVRNQTELDQFVLKMLTEKSLAKEMGKRAKELVLAQQGATEKTVDIILKQI